MENTANNNGPSAPSGGARHRRHRAPTVSSTGSAETAKQQPPKKTKREVVLVPTEALPAAAPVVVVAPKPAVVAAPKSVAPKAATAAKPTHCFAFQKGNCRHGEQCRYSHTLDETITTTTAAAPPAAPSAVCHAFQKGKCNRGSDCRFAHTLSAPAAPTATAPAVPAVAAPVTLAPAEHHAPAGHTHSHTKHAHTAAEGDKPLIHMSSTEFASLEVCPSTRKAIAEVLKYQFLTHVQEASLPVILQGKDCLAKAKTGTGKTLGFLIPSIELMVKNAALIDAHHIPTLVISPNRELAGQIAEEAKVLLTFNPVRKAVVCLYGGVKITKDVTLLKQDNIAVLVVTPGRFIDHLQNTPGFVQRLQSVRMVVLDEADQLLDMGFKPAIDRIFAALPPPARRQTLLFSATVPKAVQDIAKSTLRAGYEFVDTVGEATAEQTHEHVAQELVVVPEMQDLIATVYAVLQEQVSRSPQDHKIIVFFPTARAAGFMAGIFSSAQGLRMPVLEIHSRMSQGARQKTSDQFRTGKRVILFSSDVSARGMDYPDVSFVLQVGSTEKSQYIHRLGRTARAGKEGSGMLVLNGFEERSMLKELQGLPLTPRPLPTLNIATHAERVNAALQQVVRQEEMKKSAEQAYQAWLGYYNGKLRVLNWTKEQLVEKANEYSRSCGLREVPALEAKTVGKMGLRGTPGLRIAGR